MTGIAGAIVWLIVATGFLFLESVTAQFVSIWFGAGALVTIIPAAMGFSFTTQMLIFTIASIAVLIALRPVAKRRFTRENQPTNADMVVGMTGVVTEDIDNYAGAGRVTANGLSWSARTTGDLPVTAGEKVKVVRIEGVKLIVEPLTEKRSVTA